MARRDGGGPQQGADAQRQTIRFVDESGFDPRPSVVRTEAPIGHPPIGREWWTRAHLAAIRALAPVGQWSFRGQDRALNAVDVVAFLEHLWREVAGRMGRIWDGAPRHRRRVIKDCLADGAAQRLQRPRLPAYAPELHPGEGLWQQRNGVERRHVGCLNLPHLRHELRDAVKRGRKNPAFSKAVSEVQTLRSLRPDQ